MHCEEKGKGPEVKGLPALAEVVAVPAKEHMLNLLLDCASTWLEQRANTELYLVAFSYCLVL